MAEHYNPIKYIYDSDNQETYELESVGILIDDNVATGDRLGSTVVKSVNTGANVNLLSDKNVQIKAANGKLIYDTTSTVAANGDNELLVISRIKDQTLSTAGFFLGETTTPKYKGDHGDVAYEVRRFRIKTFYCPKPDQRSGFSDVLPVDRGKYYDGFLQLDTAGLEDTKCGGIGQEDSFDIRVKSSDVSSPTLTTPEYRALEIKTRGIDLRCMEHGGIALLPCGYDHPSLAGQYTHHENKIKFESSRIKPITVGYTASGFVSDTSAYVKDSKWVKGGLGMEFGTFNNLHSSLFSKDYRFNKDGKVYAVTRGALETASSGKIDYPTLGDDFKDILMDTAGSACTYTDAAGWTPGTDALVLGATWEDIIKSANYISAKKDALDILTGGSSSGDGVDKTTLTPEELAAVSYVYTNKTTLETLVNGGGGSGLSDDQSTFLTNLSGSFSYGDNKLTVLRDLVLQTEGDTETATWRDIVKTAFAFNSSPNRHALITNKGHLEISTEKTYGWTEVATPADVTDITEATLCNNINLTYNSGNLSDASASYVVDATYKIGELYYKFTEISSPNIKLESGASVTVSSNNNIELTAVEDVKIKATNATLDSTAVTKIEGEIVKINAEPTIPGSQSYVSFDSTSKVVFLTLKVTKNAVLESDGTNFVAGVLNNTGKTVYLTSDGKVKYPLDILYTAVDTPFVPNSGMAKSGIVYTDAACTNQVDKDVCESYLIEDAAHTVWICAINKDHQVKKDGSSKGTDDSYPTTLEAVASNYSNTIFVASNYEPLEGESAVGAGALVGSYEVPAEDIIKLVNWFKNGAGKSSGPWAD